LGVIDLKKGDSLLTNGLRSGEICGASNEMLHTNAQSAQISGNTDGMRQQRPQITATYSPRIALIGLY